MAVFTVACHDCKKSHTFDGLLPFREECDQCAADLHVCITCRYFDRHVENQCREPVADPVATKDRRNLCEYWKPIARAPGERDATSDAKAKLAALFGDAPTKSPPPAASDGDESSEADDAKRKLEQLFKK